MKFNDFLACWKQLQMLLKCQIFHICIQCDNFELPFFNLVMSPKHELWHKRRGKSRGENALHKFSQCLDPDHNQDLQLDRQYWWNQRDRCITLYYACACLHVKNTVQDLCFEIVNGLDQQHVDIIHQRFYKNMTMKEIGKENGYSRETARRRVKNAIKSCKESAL